MARAKKASYGRQGVRTGDGTLRPPLQGGSASAFWGYSHKSNKWFAMDPPTREELLKHAERFGVDQIAETAAEQGYSVEDLADLIERLDSIDDIHAKKLGKRYSKKRRSAPETRAKRMLKKLGFEVEDEQEDE